MASLNQVTIIGHLGAAPQLRHTNSGTAVATLNVATNERWTSNGQTQERTEWHRVSLWGKQAENSAKYLRKGSMVCVQGSLRTQKWTDAQGVVRYTTQINGRQCQFLDRAGSSQSTDTSSTASEPSLDEVFDEAPHGVVEQEEDTVAARLRALTTSRTPPAF